MLIKVMMIDENGYCIGDNQIEDEHGIPEDCIAVEVQEGLHLPKWDGEKWVEGKSQEEIDAIRNAPIQPTPLEQIRLEQAQSNSEMIELMMAMMMGGL